MKGNIDSSQADLIAHARQNLSQSEEPLSRNPFKAGMQRAREAKLATEAKQRAKSKYAAAVASGDIQELAGAKLHRWGWKVVGALVLVGLFVKFAPSSDESTMTFAELASRAEAVAEWDCDAEAKRRVKNPSSYDSDWAGTKLVGREWWIQANFRAMNGFGAMLDSHFVCRYDIDRKKVVAIELFEGAK